ncbi:unnamed protein product [Peniophora sp. CBMAI 1063]|nr:unnamed protein product [Peniophora sp. CBMAI 1063]
MSSVPSSSSDEFMNRDIAAELAKDPVGLAFAVVLRYLVERDPRLEDLKSTNLMYSDEACALVLKAIEERDYTELRDHLLTLTAKPDVVLEGGKEATVKSWEQPFEGRAHAALWAHIVGHFKRQPRNYSPYCFIVQSSGTGKSRCVDELSKTHLVAPLNVRRPGSRGFPAADSQLHRFFTQVSPRMGVRMNAIICALLLETAQKIENEYASSGLDNLPGWLRSFMTEGQSFDAQGPRRIDFYDTVVQTANSLLAMEYTPPISGPRPSVVQEASQSSSPPRIQFNTRTGLVDVHSAARYLREACRKTNHPVQDDEPVIIVSIDEAHELTTTDEFGARNGTSLAHIRRALRSMDDGIFFIFLSTSAKILQFTDPRNLVPSSRVSSDSVRLIPPFMALGWDHLAPRLDWPQQGLSFESIGYGYQVRLGRPLFGTRYLAGGEEAGERRMLQFAAQKLLCGPYTPWRQLSSDQQLACLARRLPIEFMPNPNVELEMKQVEKHMRVCMGDLTSLATNSPSEPILSEAASMIMNEYPDFSPPFALSLRLEGLYARRGDRGEMAGMLLAIMSRDAVVHRTPGSSNSGFFSAVEFMRELFGAIPTIFEATPSVYVAESVKDVPLKSAFADIHLHFNHFIRRNSVDIDIDQLFGFVLRNAALLGANAQPGFDILLPLCHGRSLSRSSLSWILVQLKNDPDYSAENSDSLFDHMDPVMLGLVKRGEVLRTPMIRIVMALAGKTPALKCVKRHRTADFTSYDFVASGLTSSVYPAVGQAESIWRAIRGPPHGWKDVYGGNTVTEEMRALKMSMTPMAGDEEAFWSWMPKKPAVRVQGVDDE